MNIFHPRSRFAVISGLILLSGALVPGRLHAIDATLTDDASTFADKPGKHTGTSAVLSLRMTGTNAKTA